MALVSNFVAPAPPFARVFHTHDITVASESPGDFRARERLLDEAFGAGRFDKTVERLRAGRLPARRLALTAKNESGLVGTLRLWPVHAGGVPALLLGPLAVAKACRSRGIGKALMEEALARAENDGHAAVLLVGDAAYYEPFGFSRHHRLGLVLPGPVDETRFLGLELKCGALKAAQGLVIAAGARDLPAHRRTIEFRRAA